MNLRRCLAFLAVALACTFLWQSARADLMLFKDGFVLKGRVKYESTLLEHGISIPATGKPYWLEDGVRVVFFAPGQLQDGIPVNEKELKAEWVRFDLVKPGGVKSPLPRAWEVKDVSPWDDRWQRTVSLDLPLDPKTGLIRKVEIVQRITQLTPEVLRVDSKDRDWTCCYKTSECSPQMLRDLILKQLKKDVNNSDLENRGKVYRFFLQAGFLEEAGKELEYIQDKYPAQESAIKPLLEGIKTRQAREFVEDLKRADKAGIHGEVERKLKEYARRDLDKLVNAMTQLEVQAIKDKYEALQQKMKEGRRLLYGFAEITPQSKREMFKAAAAALTEEISPDTVGRLDTFITQAQDYERALKDQRRPEQTPEQIMAFAVTGWLRGSNAAEGNVEVAKKQWEIRQLLIEYFQTDDVSARRKLLPALQARGLSVDEAMQMLKLLPPAEPEEIKKGPIKLTAQGKGGAAYEVLLPPGYTHAHAWPVMIALHHSQEKPGQVLEKWGELAAQHGYILVAPLRGKGLSVNYQYTSAEHAIVLDTLRDVRRRFQVDSDRVFLYGGEQGANMAFDVGLSHPDQFAGVIPMSGSPIYFPKRYFTNAQYLQLYIINGEKTGEAADYTKQMMKDWIRGNYPAIYVEYKGRPYDWFGGEQPIIFDWMNRKRRAHPLKEVGRVEEEFRTQREGDTQFYWLSTSGVKTDRINFKNGKWNADTKNATMMATVFTDNLIVVKTSGVGPVTLWFGPKLVDYTRKVTIKNNGTQAAYTITPSLEVLLEHQYFTADRQQMYFARLDLK
jgi:pimeloyl-ACP methyl ester carboxylesterase